MLPGESLIAARPRQFDSLDFGMTFEPKVNNVL